MVDQRIREIVETYLGILQESGFEVTKGVIFGSQVSGKAGKWSDIDLLVISPRFDRARKREDINQLWHLAARSDSRIEPVPCGELQWLEDDTSAIVEIARRKGEVVTVQ